jgi:phthalate 4,5-dioxygenase oxygenase subunit
MLSKRNSDLIARTDGEAPMGKLMRRYWIPALLSEEIPESDAPPVRVRILGEELVAFRDTKGRIGLLAEHCSHRGTSLFYGRNENCGLSCIYHGWKYDVEGNVLETPAEPARSTIKNKVQHPSYPTHEAAGVIWAYLGPIEKMPLFPNYGFVTAPLANVYVTKALLECNWLQGLEGECDSAHASFLHSRFDQYARKAGIQVDESPEFETKNADFGVYMAAIRAVPESDLQYVRVTTFVMPVSVWIAVGHHEIHMYVPIDDTHTWRYDLGYMGRPVEEDDMSRRRHIGPNYERYENLSNDYLQDRTMQRDRNFTGIERFIPAHAPLTLDGKSDIGSFKHYLGSFLAQDACVTETMSYDGLFDRTKERLGMSDIGVIAVRDYLLKTVKAFQQGLEPPHTIHTESDNDMVRVDTVDGAFSATTPLDRALAPFGDYSGSGRKTSVD